MGIANVIMDRKIGPSVKLMAVFFIREIILARLGKFKNVPCKNSLLEELYCGENRERISLEKGRIGLSWVKGVKQTNREEGSS